MILNNEDRSVDANRDQLTSAPAEVRPESAVIGDVVGGLAEKEVTEAVDLTREGAYRSDNCRGRDNVENGSGFDHCGPAYGFGVNARKRYPGRDFDDVASEMASEWAASRGASILSWEWAKHAARDAWDRISPSSCLCA